MTSTKRWTSPDGRKSHRPHSDLIDLAIDERTNLANAESALRVLKVALTHQDPEAARSAHCANVVELAANTIARTIRTLDSLQLQEAGTVK